MNHQDISNAFGGKVARGIFNPVARRIPAAYEREDRLQDAIAQTWEAFARYAGRGKVCSMTHVVLRAHRRDRR